MCGIAGIYLKDGSVSSGLLRVMRNSLLHRGPDDSGYWIDSDVSFGLVHTRLSILDLSPLGSQPMLSESRRWVIAFNGEIYNHLDIRRSITKSGLAYQWKGSSDTETLLALIDLLGPEKALQDISGMFAFALWDTKKKSLFLARDKFGEKPLYYGFVGNDFVFSSDLSTIRQLPGFNSTVSELAVTGYMRHGYVPSPLSIYEKIKKLPAGAIVEYSNNHVAEPKIYWDFEKIVTSEKRGSLTEASLLDLENLLTKAVSRQMLSDVPIGAFLSGGVDSSLIVSIMQSMSVNPIKTFTVGFNVSGYNEANYAKSIADYLGTDHHEINISSEDCLNVIPSLGYVWTEPFADSSQIPTLLLSKYTADSVKVVLSGDGGDEAFCGYTRYLSGDRLYKKIGKQPAFIGHLLSRILCFAPVSAMDMLANYLPKKYRYPHFGDKVKKLASMLSHSSRNNFYRSLISLFPDPENYVTNGRNPESLLNSPASWPKLSDFKEIMMYLDTMTYLPDDILTKVDRAAMSVGLETRAPFLDSDLVKFAWSVPVAEKTYDGQGKWHLRQLLYRHIPRELVDRPKMGFGVPIEHWLNGPLKEWAQDLLSVDCLRTHGIFDSVRVRKMVEEHFSGRRRWHHQLWTILMFQVWFNTNMGR